VSDCCLTSNGKLFSYIAWREQIAFDVMMMMSGVRLYYDRSWVRSGSCQIKDYDIGSCCFSARNAASDGVRVNTGWLGVRIKCPSGETRVPVDCCFSELGLV
jgi:hypothetical protein